jgi:feruloyl esterase
MEWLRRSIVVGAVLFLILLTGGRPGLCAIKCADLPGIISDPGLTGPVSAALKPAAAGVPEFCEVRGTIAPEVKFAVKLPAEWNGRFYMVGGGGFNGSINDGAMTPALARGYATAGTDSGHDGQKEKLATFAYNPPDNSNPNALQKKLDFAYRSYHDTAAMAKKIIKAYYGSDARYSYWVGCSEGGREALLMAQRFPELFDGIIVGAPVLNLTGAHMWSLWNPRALTGDGSIAVNQLPFLADAIYKKCDGIDGLVDGLIEDPRACAFDPAKDLPRCDTASPTCFTTGQIDALKKIYDGVRTSKGELLYPGMPPGAEVLAPTSGWDQWLIGSPSRQQLYGESSMQYLSLNPQPGPAWKWTDYNFDTDPPRMAVSSVLFDMINPDLTRFKKRGGKMIHYHGWADTALTPLMSIAYYEDVLGLMGKKETENFYKLYLLPGIFHCGGGAGCYDRADVHIWFDRIVDWVEKGIEPRAIVGARKDASGKVIRTRPFCPYPMVARYTGNGDINEAANFTCVEVAPPKSESTPGKE